MKKGYLFFILISSSLLYAQADRSLVLNEIMFYAASGNNEYIEIYNLSGTESFNLENYKIKVESSVSDIITDAGYGSILPPHSYAVVVEGDYDFASGIYSWIIPQNALILKLTDNAFGSSGMSNTSDRTVRLINSTDDTIGYHTYHADNNSSFSEEKIIMSSTLDDNWGNSLILNGTPGFKNSITPSDFDLLISSISVLPSLILINRSAEIKLNIKNKSRNNAVFFHVEIFHDLNQDSSVNEEEKIYSVNFENLSSGDSIEVKVPVIFDSPGNQHIICRINYYEDEDLSNNIIYRMVYVFSDLNSYNDIVINEIMYSPPAGEPEWIEIFNRSDSAANLKNWSAADNSSSAIISNDISIEPGAYLVLSEDSSVQNFYSINSPFIVMNLPSLNNSGDVLVLKDSIGMIIDSVQYVHLWGGTEGKSLERIDPENSQAAGNWKSSRSKYRATPGNINSVSKKDFDLELREIVFNPAAPVFGNNVSISVKVINLGRSEAVFKLMLFNDENSDSIPDTKLEEINNLMLTAEDSAIIKFNYELINLQFESKIIVFIVQNEDQDTSNNYLSWIIFPGHPTSSLLVNEIMYSPVNGEPEWVEIYNATKDSINLRDWSISDILTISSKSDIKTDIYIPGKSFLVISKDSSVKNFHRVIASGLLIMNFPNLNNDADGIILKDERGLTIDSVKYESSWGRNGYSLERISSAAASAFKVNWTPSADLEMSTPGRINTATPKLNDLLVSEIFYDPPYPVNGENIYLKAEIKNNGSQNAYNFYVKFCIDKDSDNYPEYEVGMVLIPLLNSGDSIVVSSQTAIINLTYKMLGAVHINFNSDEDILNNYAEKTIEPGYPNNAVLINEVMFDPGENEPEWIEIVNVSGDTVNLVNWSVSDLLTAPVKGFISHEDFFLLPGELAVITKDTSFLSAHPENQSKLCFASFGALGNSTDGVLIYDFRNAVIDSFCYKSSWENMKGYSLERISTDRTTSDSTNWAVSLSGEKSSPGSPNSVSYLPEYERNSAIVNEIMYDPDIDNCEFIELYNRSDAEINIGGWRIEDEKGNFSKLSQINFIVPPLSYFTLFSDSSGIRKYNLDKNYLLNILNRGDLGLTNSGELILLKDIKGRIIDSVWYSEQWHNSNFILTKNKSLERINPFINGNDNYNWSSSADLSGATPGRINSIYTDNNSTVQSKISVSPNPFSPDNDGFEDFTLVNCILSHPASHVRIKIFDSRGRLVRTLINNQATGANTSIVFDGLEDNGTPMRMGIYIILLEALNENTGVQESLKTTAVIARKLN